PPPANMTSSGDSPGGATAFVNFHSPVVAVSRNCEHIRNCGHDHHSAQHSNQKNPHHLSSHETPFCFLFKTVRSIILFMARLGDFPVPLTSCSELSLLHVLSPQFLYLAFVTRRQAGSVRRC